MAAQMDNTDFNLRDALDELEKIVVESSKVPIYNKVIIDPQDIYEILDDIRNNLPRVISEAQNLVDQRQQYLTRAQQEADQILYNAQERVKTLLDENVITRQAKERAALTIQEAEQQASNILNTARSNANELTMKTQEDIRNMTLHAQQQSSQTLGNASRNSQEMRQGAYDFSDHILSEAEAALSRALESVQKTHREFQSAAAGSGQAPQQPQQNMGGVQRTAPVQGMGQPASQNPNGGQPARSSRNSSARYNREDEAADPQARRRRR